MAVICVYLYTLLHVYHTHVKKILHIHYLTYKTTASSNVAKNKYMHTVLNITRWSHILLHMYVYIHCMLNSLKKMYQYTHVLYMYMYILFSSNLVDNVTIIIMIWREQIQLWNDAQNPWEMHGTCIWILFKEIWFIINSINEFLLFIYLILQFIYKYIDNWHLHNIHSCTFFIRIHSNLHGSKQI